MGIMDWPVLERPREKLIARGAQVLGDAELLAILLRSGSGGRNAVDVARQVLADAGGLTQLSQLSHNQFCKMPGLGKASFAQLQSALEIARRQALETLERGDALSSPAAVKRFLALQLGSA